VANDEHRKLEEFIGC